MIWRNIHVKIVAISKINIFDSQYCVYTFNQYFWFAMGNWMDAKICGGSKISMFFLNTFSIRCLCSPRMWTEPLSCWCTVSLWRSTICTHTRAQPASDLCIELHASDSHMCLSIYTRKGALDMSNIRMPHTQTHAYSQRSHIHARTVACFPHDACTCVHIESARVERLSRTS